MKKRELVITALLIVLISVGVALGVNFIGIHIIDKNVVSEKETAYVESFQSGMKLQKNIDTAIITFRNDEAVLSKLNEIEDELINSPQSLESIKKKIKEVDELTN